MQRINVVGTSCSGKTTMARALGHRLQLPHVEIDALYWEPNWTAAPQPVFRDRLEAALAGDAWIADGGYELARDITWRRADTVVWLDYRLSVVLGRWARRTVRRIRSREEFWPGTGNRESVRNALRRDGLLWWILRTHRGRRKRMIARLEQRPDLRVVRLRSPRDAEDWLARI